MRTKGYIRVAKSDGPPALETQRRALEAAGVATRNIYSDVASGKWDTRPGLEACLKALHPGDTLVVWKLDRLCRNLTHVVATVHSLTKRDIGLRVLTGSGRALNTTPGSGRQVTRVFAALAEFERTLTSESRRAARHVSARGRGRTPTMTPTKLRQAISAMGKKGTVVADLCKELGINRSTLYRYLSPTGELRTPGKKLLGSPARSLSEESNSLKVQVEKFLAKIPGTTSGDVSEK